MNDKINSYKDLRVFQNAMKAAMKIFQLSESFPPEEKYSMTDQLRRSSRCVCANITRAWRKRKRMSNGCVQRTSLARSSFP